MPVEREAWEFASAPRGLAPGTSSMVGYRAHDAPEALHRGLPSSRLTFIVSLDDGVIASGTASGLATTRPVPIILGGLHTEATFVRERPQQTGIQLAVHPLAARAVFGVPAVDLSTVDFDGGSLLAADGDRLRQQIAEATDWDGAFQRMRDFLVSRFDDGAFGRLRPELAGAWRLLEHRRGRILISDLASAVGLSTRQLGTLFRREVGRSPKTVAGLMRFEHATARIASAVRSRGRVELAGIAAETGFADQAHFTREFAHFAGSAPRDWITEEFRNLQDGGHAAAEDWLHD